MGAQTLASEIACLLAIISAFATASVISSVGFPVTDQRGRKGCIDGLRGYLALLVLIGHSIIWINVTRGNGLWGGAWLSPFDGLGASAVPLFFMVTGFLFYSKALRGIRGNNWVALLIARAFRILPLVVLSVALIGVIIWWRFGTPRGFRWAELLGPAARWILSVGEPPILRHPDSGRLNAYVFWSLSYEWVFYLVILPFLATMFSLKPRSVPSWIMPTIFLCACVALKIAKWGKTADVMLFFPLGMLAYEIQLRESLRQWFTTNPVAAVAAICWLATGFAPNLSPVLKAPFWWLLFTAAACGNNFWGLLQTKGSVALGECSFGIYVLHGIFLSTFFPSPTAATLAPSLLPFAIPVLVIAVVITTSITYVQVERRFLEWGSDLAKRVTHKRLAMSPEMLEVAP